jgi:short-subunit dehydrogenase
MFQLLCFAIIRLLHYLLDTYMCKTNGCDILVISRVSVAGNVVGMKTQRG